jgi:hypothetical protein
LTVFGAAAVSLMALTYALERRHRACIALFAIACALSSAYGFLIGSLPFGSVEALWSVVALQRFCVAGTARHRLSAGLQAHQLELPGGIPVTPPERSTSEPSVGTVPLSCASQPSLGPLGPVGPVWFQLSGVSLEKQWCVAESITRTKPKTPRQPWITPFESGMLA